MGDTLSKEDLKTINAYWRAANYLSVGQIYLYANPLLKKPLKLEDIKPRLLGHDCSDTGALPPGLISFMHISTGSSTKMT
jgi:phosphoketolase